MTRLEFLNALAGKMEGAVPGRVCEVTTHRGQPTLFIDEVPIERLWFDAREHCRWVAQKTGPSIQVSTPRYYIKLNDVHVAQGIADVARALSKTAAAVEASLPELRMKYTVQSTNDRANRGILHLETAMNISGYSLGCYVDASASEASFPVGRFYLTAMIRFDPLMDDDQMKRMADWTRQKKAEISRWQQEVDEMGLGPKVRQEEEEVGDSL